jgi:adenine phosphoribosyltransferase
MTVRTSKALLEKAPEFDYIITAEAKGIPLGFEMSRQSGKKYFVARKGLKLYMQEPFKVEVRSITTDKLQTLYLDKSEADEMKGKKVLIVDDVISTGESLKAIEVLCEKAGAEVVGKCAVLAEGDAAKRDDIFFIQELPLFFK